MDEQFKPVTATPVVDPTKHVNYSYGMVLGVDDFTQEFVYHSERDQWMTRDVDGYGTVSGLAVRVARNANGEQEVIVSAGAAVNPRGQMICVPVAQCAVVERWLAVEANRKGAEKKAGESPGAPLGVYVVLCYRECPTDKVPVPGEPCRSEDETVAPSRLKDDFRLELRLAPPAQTEELALRAFVRLLRQHVEFTDEAGGAADDDTYAEAVREIAEAAYSPSSPPDSPPGYGEGGLFRVPAEFRCEFLRCAFRVWVTEIRPRVRPDLPGSHCSCADERHDHGAHGGDEDCVLLAELRVNLTPDTLVDETRDVRVIESRRPLLVHQRMLQEWLLCGSCCADEQEHTYDDPGVPSPPEPAPPAELALDDLSDVTVVAPQAGDVLTFGEGGEWVAAPPADGGATGAAGGDLEGAYPDPTIKSLRGFEVSGDEPKTGQVLTWDGNQWRPDDVPPDDEAIHTGDAAGGDLAGTYPSPTVARLRGKPVSNVAPNPGDVLRWIEPENEWRPVPLPPAPPPPRPAPRALLPFVTITERPADSEKGASFNLWFHLDVPTNLVEILSSLLPKGTTVSAESDVETVTPPAVNPDFLVPLKITGIVGAGARNLFRLDVEGRAQLYRFRFDLGTLRVKTRDGEQRILDYTQKRELNFVGFDGRATVTAFVVGGVARQISGV